ncbi:MAG TPA: isopentenyl-diphosphate delta-isomerase [Lachnospiraceae bacterium]|nr:isopentenyl-diphosphate delta-isomerase [Lachnospiraceae bacterium]
MRTDAELRQEIRRIDRKGYPAYKDLAGSWAFPKYTLSIDHVQGDPFAAPSKVSIWVSGRRSGFPGELYSTAERRIAFEDGLVRAFSEEAARFSFRAHGSGKSGLIGCSRPGQEILERTACHVDPASGDIVMRMEIGFPANGRSISAGELIRILFEYLPAISERTLFRHREDEAKKRAAAELADDQAFLRRYLLENDLVAFVANGSVLPRESGVSQRPLQKAVPFRSPGEMEVTIRLPHRGEVSGMGIAKGITLIVGGGYHGKSTLLEALERGVYNHIAGDGRELVITEETAVKIRAEDGRRICGTDISMFINNLPSGTDCRRFYSDNASGSTSQAANTIEAIEAGCRTFLIDEDTCATNFMLRDALMAKVVSEEKEPITPFIARARDLYEKEGISTVLVAGSSGAYFRIADRVIQMDEYVPREITEKARAAALAFGPGNELPESSWPGTPVFDRVPARAKNRESGQRRAKSKVMGKDSFSINRENVDLRGLAQIADTEQVQALAQCLKVLEAEIFDGNRTVREALALLESRIGQEGLTALSDTRRNVPAMAMPRRQEIFQCVNRYRSLGLIKK